MSYAQLVNEVSTCKELMASLGFAEAVKLRQWRIVGGALRDHFWGLRNPHRIYAPKDIDLIFFDPTDCSKDVEREIENHLEKISGKKWSVKNQARMHEANSDLPYVNILDAISKFPLQVDTTALSCTAEGLPLLSTIYGYQDLVLPAVRPTMHYQTMDRQALLIRYIERKKFAEVWPEAKLILTPQNEYQQTFRQSARR